MCLIEASQLSKERVCVCVCVCYYCRDNCVLLREGLIFLQYNTVAAIYK